MTKQEQQEKLAQAAAQAAAAKGLECNLSIVNGENRKITIQGLQHNEYVYDKVTGLVVMCVAVKESDGGSCYQFMVEGKPFTGSNGPGVYRHPILQNAAGNTLHLNDGMNNPLKIKTSSLEIVKPSKRQLDEATAEELARQREEIARFKEFCKAHNIDYK